MDIFSGSKPLDQLIAFFFFSIKEASYDPGPINSLVVVFGVLQNFLSFINNWNLLLKILFSSLYALPSIKFVLLLSIKKRIWVLLMELECLEVKEDIVELLLLFSWFFILELFFSFSFSISFSVISLLIIFIVFSFSIIICLSLSFINLSCAFRILLIYSHLLKAFLISPFFLSLSALICNKFLPLIFCTLNFLVLDIHFFHLG